MQSKKISLSNWSHNENEFYKKREDLLLQLSSKEVASAPFVFSDRQTLTTALTRIDLFRKVLDVQGAIVECGVHKGNSLFLYNHLSTILESYNFNRKIIGFDTFEGFQSISDKDDQNLKASDFADTSYDLLKDWSLLHSQNRAVSHIEKIELIKGDATKTIPKFVNENPHLIIALLYLDFDIYAPTKVALEHLLPLVPKGGIIGLDEVNCKKWEGETIALKESLSINTIKLKKFYYDPWTSYYVVD